LNSLFEPPTSQDKPPYPYTTILRFAILGSPRKKLTLGEIYETMENRFPWFKNNTDKGWRNSVRHTLSLGKCFVKVNRPVTEPGKGAYWSFDPSQGEGKVRPRNR
ncbi:uncharacterized protein EI90DRAFT_2872920, partial [Cantharellus anzutake]|uniref:uncharacterized protein n=1 Tax=Cantharellus anzutake TaxID=1750568 RepID=UPI001907BBA0